MRKKRKSILSNIELEICNICNGTGFDFNNSYEFPYICKKCNGSGYID